MKALRVLLIAIGIVAVLIGLVWAAQGTGMLMWPAESFMLADRQWAVNGAALAAAGLAMIWIARRR